MRLISVIDGKQVNIPVPCTNAMWGRRKLCHPTVGIVGLSMQVGVIGKSVTLILRCDEDSLRARSDRYYASRKSH